MINTEERFFELVRLFIQMGRTPEEASNSALEVIRRYTEARERGCQVTPKPVLLTESKPINPTYYTKDPEFNQF
jgi:hypothetical protein